MSFKFCLQKLWLILLSLLLILVLSLLVFFLLEKIINETDFPLEEQKFNNDQKRVKRQTYPHHTLAKFPLRIQAFKSPYEQNLILDSFLDQHELITSYPQSEEDGENLLYTLRLKWREQFYLKKFILLIFPTQTHHLGQDLWAQAKALLASRPKIVLIEDNKHQIPPNSSSTAAPPPPPPQNLILDYWKDRNYGTVFRLQKQIKLDIMGPILLIERIESNDKKIDHFPTTSNSNKNTKFDILRYQNYTLNHHDNRAVELILYAGVNKAQAHIRDIVQWEVGLVLTNFTPPILTTEEPPLGHPDFDDDTTTENPSDWPTTNEDIFYENETNKTIISMETLTPPPDDGTESRWEEKIFFYKITPKFLTLDQLTLRFLILEEKSRQNTDHTPAHSINPALIETTRKIKNIASKIRPLNRALSFLKNLEPHQNYSAQPQHHEEGNKKMAAAADILEQIERQEKAATAIILGDGGKTMSEILVQRKALDDLYESLREEKDQLFHLDRESIQGKRDHLKNQALILTQWIQLHQDQDEFVRQNFPDHLQELEEIDPGHHKPIWPTVQTNNTKKGDDPNHWSLREMEEIEKEKIDLETNLLDPKMDLALQTQINRTASTIPILRERVTLLTLKLEKVNVNFVKSRPAWNQINRLRAKWIILLLTRTTNADVDPRRDLSGQLDVREMSWQKVERMAKKFELMREFIDDNFVRNMTSPPPSPKRTSGVMELKSMGNDHYEDHIDDLELPDNEIQKESKYGLDLDDLLRMMESQNSQAAQRRDNFVQNFFTAVEHGLVHQNVSIFMGSKTFLRRLLIPQDETKKSKIAPVDHHHHHRRRLKQLKQFGPKKDQKLPFIMDRLGTDSGEPFYASIGRNFQKSAILKDSTTMAILGRLTGIIQEGHPLPESTKSWSRRSWKITEDGIRDKNMRRRRRSIYTNEMTKWLIMAGHVTAVNFKSFWDPNVLQSGFAMDHLLSSGHKCSGKGDQKDGPLMGPENNSYFCQGQKSWAHIGLLTLTCDQIEKFLIVYKPTEWNNAPKSWDQNQQNWDHEMSRIYPKIKISDMSTHHNHPSSHHGHIPDDMENPNFWLDKGPQLTKTEGVHYHGMGHQTIIRDYENGELYWAHFIPSKMANGVQPVQDNTVRVRFSDWGQRLADREYVDPDQFNFNRRLPQVGPKKLNDFNLFCRPLVAPSVAKGMGKGRTKLVYTHHCENAVGIRLHRDTPVKNLYALFRLGDGEDEIVGFQNLPNFFEVGSGHKNFSGGSSKDIFMIQNGFTGILTGLAVDNPQPEKDEQNTLILSNDLNATIVQLINRWRTLGGSDQNMENRQFEQKLIVDGQMATLVMMTDVVGRKNLKDTIHATCHTKTIDGQGGGGGGEVDEILVPNMVCGGQWGQSQDNLYKVEIEVRSATNITNQYDGHGAAIFLYNLEKIGNPSIKMSAQSHLTIFTSGATNKKLGRAQHLIRLHGESSRVNFSVDSLIFPPSLSHDQNGPSVHPIISIKIREDGADFLTINLKDKDGHHKSPKVDPHTTLTMATLDDDNFLNFIQNHDGHYTLQINLFARNSSLSLKMDSPPQTVRMIQRNQNGKAAPQVDGGVDLNFDPVSPSNSMIQTVTVDGAKIILVKEKSIMMIDDTEDVVIVPKFYFFVNTTTKSKIEENENGVIRGSELTSNLFYVPEGGHFGQIFGGKMADHFKLGRPPSSHFPPPFAKNFESGPTIFSTNDAATTGYKNLEDGGDTIEIIGNSVQDDVCSLDLTKSQILWQNDLHHHHRQVNQKDEESTIRLEGSFEIILGRKEAVENLVADCHVKYVDLKGGLVGKRECGRQPSYFVLPGQNYEKQQHDLVTIPNRIDAGNCVNPPTMKIQIREATRVENMCDGPGHFLYHVMKGSGPQLLVPVSNSHQNVNDPSASSSSWGQPAHKRVIILKEVQNLGSVKKRTDLIQIDYLVTQLDLKVVQKNGVTMGQNVSELDILKITSIDPYDGRLELEVHVLMESLAGAMTTTNIMTADGARITVFKKDGKFHPAFQFQLNQSKAHDDDDDDDGKKIIKASLILPNHFNLIMGHYPEIVGGHMDDHFQIRGPNIQLHRLDSGPGEGVDVIEIGHNFESTPEFRDPVTIDLQTKFLRIGNKTGGIQHVSGDFEHIYGRRYAPEQVIPSCSVRSIDLGGSSGDMTTVDQIWVPSSSLCTSHNLSMKIWPSTKVVVEGGGKFWYHFQNHRHHHHQQQVVIGVIGNGTNFKFFSKSAPNSTHSTIKLMNGPLGAENRILLDYAAHELEAEQEWGSGSQNEWLIGSKKLDKNRHDLQLILGDPKILKNVVVATRDGAQIILDDSKKRPSFLFDLFSGSKNGGQNPQILRGAERNENNFFIKETTGIDEIHGGILQDRFVIGGATAAISTAMTTTTYLNGGGGRGEDILEIFDFDPPTNDDDLITSFDLVKGKIEFLNGDHHQTENDGLTLTNHTLTLKDATFKHFVGRVNGTDRLIASCQTKTVNLGEKILTNKKRQLLSIPDHILVPPSSLVIGEPHCFYDLVIQCGNDMSTIIFNGGDKGQVYIKVDRVSGHFSLYTLGHQSTSHGINGGSRVRGQPTKANDGKQQDIIMTSIYHLNMSFFHLKDIEVDPTKMLVTVRHGPKKNYKSRDNDHDTSEEEELAHFQTFQLHSAHQMIQIFEGMTQNKFIMDKAQLSGEGDHILYKKVKNLAHSYQNDGNHAEAELKAVEVEVDEMINGIPLPEIKFPTFYTADNYQIKINHVGGLHVLYTDRTSSKSIDDLIRDHVHLINSLGLTLTISIVKNEKETPPPPGVGIPGGENISAIIYMGGDDELDVLINHPNIESHLVAAGGEGGIFKIFPTKPTNLNQSVFIYLAKPRWPKHHHHHQLAEEKSESQSNEPTIDLNLDDGVGGNFDPNQNADDPTSSFKMWKNKLKKYRLSLDAFGGHGSSSSWRSKLIRDDDENIPKIIQQKNDLRISVPYYIPMKNFTGSQSKGQSKIDPEVEKNEGEGEEEEVKVFQQIVLVNGIHHWDQLEVTLDTIVWHMKKVYREENNSTDSQKWVWVLESQNLILNPPLLISSIIDPDDANMESGDDGADDVNDPLQTPPPLKRKSRHVIMSADDLIQHRKLQIPLILNRPVNRPDIALYRNGTTLICTNGLDPNPPFKFDWDSPSLDYSVQARMEPENELFSFILVDIRGAMEIQNFTLILHLQDPTLSFDPSVVVEEEEHEIFTISTQNFDHLKDYGVAKREMERKIFSNRLTFWTLLILILMVCLSLLAVFILLMYRIIVKFKYSGYSTAKLFPGGSLQVKEGGGIHGKGKYFRRHFSTAQSSSRSTNRATINSTNGTVNENQPLNPRS